MNVIITDPPQEEPLTLAAAKAHLRVTHDNDDAAIGALITAARELCEGYTGRALVQRGCSVFLDRWDDVIALPCPPLVMVEQVLVDGAVLAPANYDVDDKSAPARIAPLSAVVPDQTFNGVEIRFTAGYGEAEDVPAALKEGMLRLVAHLCLNRGDAHDTALKQSGAAALFQPFRVMGVK